MGYLRARARYIQEYPCPGRKTWDLLMKNFYLGVNIPKELIKLLSRHLDALLFEIKAVLGPLGHTHVPQQSPQFWWFSEHKI
tara:strand:- start:241 stop:486 length:246 start_codon:yes stop_codon:yes gene_type:complete